MSGWRYGLVKSNQVIKKWNTDPIVDPIDFEEICKDLPPAVRATLGEFNQSHLRNAIKIFFST